ncbi:hypothetical protein PP997_gp58 [Gordonia phage BigChungus]|uniref:Uncharacterized protein n=2 Tax=Ponsvirus TaxID=3044795 RepID=A0AAE8BVA9_9CAUD|nr:hypothetical protein PP997_gp58 [Gordonia phage BigChungus]YP_010663478.1 hypothetical protein PP998_gp61 [Gordonia phage Vine]QNJ59418.1 hypothetical protein SEA_FEASTONYEET_58 [Gordonia phage Feastonyeet]UXE03298.1 hypothetical protein SEA_SUMMITACADEMY_58 [Gordonia phage SummitAcademy]QNJ59558.1 hypothetical protein SEA_BIGCHUNGUS_58 [Gordonia phage BigChungus]QZD97770.1 hypothetical protein SEA_VINE_61 [Gordonia phage Vine]
MSRKNQRDRRRTPQLPRPSERIAQVRDLPAMNIPVNPEITRQREQLKKVDYVLRMKRYGFKMGKES